MRIKNPSIKTKTLCVIHSYNDGVRDTELTKRMRAFTKSQSSHNRRKLVIDGFVDYEKKQYSITEKGKELVEWLVRHGLNYEKIMEEIG